MKAIWNRSESERCCRTITAHQKKYLEQKSNFVMCNQQQPRASRDRELTLGGASCALSRKKTNPSNGSNADGNLVPGAISDDIILNSDILAWSPPYFVRRAKTLPLCGVRIAKTVFCVDA
jgi:hypothetical protein